MIEAEARTRGRAIALLAFTGAVASVLALALSAIEGSPYLSSARVNGWVVVFAAGLLALLISLPFALEQRLHGREDDHDKRWERAVLVWGAIAVVVLALSLLVGSSSGFSGASLAGTAALITAIESGLVVIAIGAWLLSN